MRNHWFDRFLEGAEDNIDDVIDNAINGSDQGVSDISLAGTEVKDNDVVNDPEELLYDKTNSYSQEYEDYSDLGKDGTKDACISGSCKENAFSADELRAIYSEAVADLISESTDRLNQIYRSKIASARSARGFNESTTTIDGTINDIMNNIF